MKHNDTMTTQAGTYTSGKFIPASRTGYNRRQFTRRHSILARIIAFLFAI